MRCSYILLCLLWGDCYCFFFPTCFCVQTKIFRVFPLHSEKLSSNEELNDFSLKQHFPLRKLLNTDCIIQYSRSGGAGGQNVNKVSTKAEVRFDLHKAKEWIPIEILEHIYQNEGSKINKDGILIVTSSKHRTQLENKKDALLKIQTIIDSAELCSQPKKEPSKEKLERIKMLKRNANQKRLIFKKMKSAKKLNRKKSFDY
mmetsp:Transcript_29126/g.34327  ORF Transcript_29126/g.34327 Transcript_29126/m.34327 type:complete len:201 (+) Transcript_29126:81-683(+)